MCSLNTSQSFKTLDRSSNVLFLTLFAVIGDAEGWQNIEDFGETHLIWFQKRWLFLH